MVFIYELNLLSNLGVPPETLKQLFKKKNESQFHSLLNFHLHTEDKVFSEFLLEKLQMGE